MYIPKAQRQEKSLRIIHGHGHGFGTITDLQVGPDGFLYVLTFDGTIYRIVPITR
jgi:glucose/arabinose dehydrogenase